MKILVRFFSRVKEIVGEREIQLELEDGAKIRDLLETLIKLYGLTFKEEVLDKAGKPIVALMLNNEGVNLEAELKEGDVVSVLPPIAGG